MIEVFKGSVLELQGFDLISLSHSVKIADNQYYLAELHHLSTKSNKVFTWEEKDILFQNYHKCSSNFAALIQQGKKWEAFTNWPQSKKSALLQIQTKFLAPSPATKLNTGSKQEQKQAQKQQIIDGLEEQQKSENKMRNDNANQIQFEYYKIKKVKLQLKRKQVNYIVQNILGQSKFVSGSKLKKTHLRQVIEFLQKQLSIAK